MKHYLLKTILCAFALPVANAAAQEYPSFTFETSTDFDQFSVFDDNKDEQTWQYDDFDYAAYCVRDYNADDWLVSPAVALEAGKLYKVSIRAKGYTPDVAETFRVTLGGSSDPITHTSVLLTASVESDAFTEFFAMFSVETTGDYHIGIHYNTSGTSYSGSLSIDDLAIADGTSVNVPAAPEGFTATAGGKGALTAHIAFTAPTLDASGNTLAAITRIDVQRNRTVVHSFSHPAPGENLTYDDVLSQRGNYTYRAIAYNASGEGQTAQEEIFVGPDSPDTPENVSATIKDGLVTISWDAPAYGINAGYIDPAELTYTVTRRDGTVVAENTTACSVTDTPAIPEAQQLLFYKVTASNAYGTSGVVSSNRLAIGTPDDLPYAESFAGGKAAHFWTVEYDKLSRWSYYNPGDNWTQDKDGGFAAYTPMEKDEWSRLASGVINLENATNPVLTFHYFYGYPITDAFTIEVSHDGSLFEPLQTIDLTSDKQNNTWQRIEIPLKDFVGCRDFRFAFSDRATSTTTILYIDNITLIDRHDHDLAVRLNTLPRDLKVGEERTFTATVSNLGAKDVEAADFTVSLLLDGREMTTAKGKAVSAMTGTKTFTLTAVADIDLPDTVQAAARVNFEADEVAVNNISQPATVGVKPNYYPLPRHAAIADGTLTWQQPDQPRTTDGSVTESFENAPDFCITNFADWTVADLVGTHTYVASLPDETAPSYPNAGKPQAFIVFNAEAGGYPTENADGTPGRWTAHSGQRHMISFSSPATNDSWLISPQLSGHEQTVSLWMNTPTNRYGVERFTVMYSKTDPTTDSFRPVDEDSETQDEGWTLRSYDLPEGARYFAVRKTTEDGFALAIDDVTFCPDSLAARDLTLRGYNVYADNAEGKPQRMNDAPLTETTFNVPAAYAGAPAYRVTAVYAEGESAYTPAAIATGIATPPNNPTYDSRQPAYDLQGRRVAHPRAGGIYIRNGRKVLGEVR